MELGVNNGVSASPSFFLSLSLSSCPPSPSRRRPPSCFSLFQLFPRQTSLSALSPIPSYRRDRTLSLRRFIPSRKPDHAPWILFASSLVLRSCSRSKLRLPTALEVSRKSRRELYLSPGLGRRIEGERTCKPISSRRSILTAPLAVKQNARADTEGFARLHLSLRSITYSAFADTRHVRLHKRRWKTTLVEPAAVFRAPTFSPSARWFN